MNSEQLCFLLRTLGNSLTKFFDPFGCCLMRMTCKSFRTFFPEIPVFNLNSSLIPLANHAAVMGEFKIALWCVGRQYIFREYLNAKFCRTLASESDAIAQRELLLTHFYLDSSVPDFCAEENNLQLLQWADQNEYPINPRIVLHCAIKHRNEEMIKFALKFQHCPANSLRWSKSIEINDTPIIKWKAKIASAPLCDATTYLLAAENGNLELMKYLKENGCEWNRASTCSAAAKGGNLNVLKWLRDQGCSWDGETCNSAASTGNFEILKWAIANHCALGKEVIQIAAREGYFEIMFWLLEHGSVLTWAAFCEVLKRGNIEIAKKLFPSLGTPISPHTRHVECAIFSGNVALIEWLSEKGLLSHPESFCDKAAEMGKLVLVQWGFHMGFPIKEGTCISAASCGSVEILEWLKGQGLHLGESVRMTAIKNGHRNVIQWLKNGYQ
jgi:hypothetical protein